MADTGSVYVTKNKADRKEDRQTDQTDRPDKPDRHTEASSDAEQERQTRHKGQTDRQKPAAMLSRSSDGRQ